MREQLKKAITDHLVITNEAGLKYCLDKIQKLMDDYVLGFQQWANENDILHAGADQWAGRDRNYNTVELLTIYKNRKR